ncbi:MAG: DUF3999 domain-containing protein [Desulfobulbus sp.]|jgi:hypothetical protein|uniref:DUF3999 family protein n=1 Tax=Desulfobulbus sp. TaxID=895 RepID=UPI00283FCF80|nr:DUF3999 family protein [Desulfobulbus sp.]MDR2551032.1 DUF3999 domain-containing protein [Desulfobulbus sp.]
MTRVVFVCLCLVALVALVALACPPTAAASLAPGDFAAGLALPEADGTGIHALEVPVAVYEKAVRPDLADVRVFNGAGEAVPHVIRTVAESREEVRQPVPFFPLPGKESQQPGDLSLRVALQADGKVLSVDAGSRGPSTQASSYLFDATRWQAAGPLTGLLTLELYWRSPASGLVTVSLMHSNDLVHWQPLVDRAVLADLSYQGSQVVTRRISLPSRVLSYIRLDCIDCREPLLLEKVVALAGQPVAGDPWQWTRLSAGQITEDQGQRLVVYRLGAKVGVSAVQLRFPKANSLLRAAIEAREPGSGTWRQVVRSDFYRLDLEGTPLVNPMATCPPVFATEWRIRAIADHAGLEHSGSLPELELGWKRQEILFLGRGQGPYLLTFGSAKAAAETVSGQDNLVLAAVRDTGSESHIRRIKTLTPVTLAGDQALQPPKLAAVSWQKIVLWLVLIAAVALLAAMARKLLRELHAKTD